MLLKDFNSRKDNQSTPNYDCLLISKKYHICHIQSFSKKSQSTLMSILNRVCTCLFCHLCACRTGVCIDFWAATEACGLSQLQCGECVWIVCAPICYSCQVGSFDYGWDHCKIGIKYCIYSCALGFVAPIDGIYTCVCFSKDVCEGNLSGFSGIMRHVEWLNRQIRQCFNLTNGNQPIRTFNEYSP